MHQPFDQQMILTVGDMAIDTSQRSVFAAAERVDLTKREFDMLLFLAHHPGWAFTKDQLLEAVWLNPMDANHRAVENLIYWIRKKTSCSQSVRIKAVFGYGFKLLVARIKQEIPTLDVRDERVFMALLVYTGMRPEEVLGLKWEDVHLSKQYAEVKRAVTYPRRNQPVIKGTKTKKSVRTVLLPRALVEILIPCVQSSGFVCSGDQPWTWTVMDNIKQRAYKKLQIKGFSNYDFRSTFGTQLKESGLSSAIVADLMGHADTRMVETVYARTRHEGVMKQLEAVETIMRKRVYISSDYSESNGDREVVDIINFWGRDEKRIVDFVDMAQVVSGSISANSDCRPCDLKAEFNRQINASSAIIFVVGDNTAKRTAGSSCRRIENGTINCSCTPYKQNSNGSKWCKVIETVPAIDNVGNINNFSYLRHEFEQAKRRGKKIIIVYNSMYKQSTWLPEYMKEYESIAHPFWTKDQWGNRVGNYRLIKEELGYV